MHDTPTMNCPVCSVALVVSRRQGVEIDYCPTCRGVWLDRGELDKIIDRSVREMEPPARTYRPDRTSSSPDASGAGGSSRRRTSFIEDLFD